MPMAIAVPISARLNGRCGGRWYGMWVRMPRRSSRVKINRPSSRRLAAMYEEISVRCLLRNTIANRMFMIQSAAVIMSVREIKKFVNVCLLLVLCCYVAVIPLCTPIGVTFTQLAEIRPSTQGRPQGHAPCYIRASLACSCIVGTGLAPVLEPHSCSSP
jgi:hypothetical protein